MNFVLSNKIFVKCKFSNVLMINSQFLKIELSMFLKTSPPLKKHSLNVELEKSILLIVQF